MLELVIFDCDGVLIDSESIVAKIESRELAKLGYKLEPSDMVRQFAGMSTKRIYKKMQEEYGFTLPADHEHISRH